MSTVSATKSNSSIRCNTEAKKQLETELPDGALMSIVPVPEGSMVTMDYRLDRVRVYVDGDNIVTQMPRLG